MSTCGLKREKAPLLKYSCRDRLWSNLSKLKDFRKNVVRIVFYAKYSEMVHCTFLRS